MITISVTEPPIDNRTIHSIAQNIFTSQRFSAVAPVIVERKIGTEEVRIMRLLRYRKVFGLTSLALALGT